MPNQLPENITVDIDDYGLRLRGLRKVRGLSQRELARQAGITNGSLSQIESNAVSPSVGTLAKLLHVLNISLSDFFSGSYSLTGQVFLAEDYSYLKAPSGLHQVLSASLGKENYRYLEVKTLAPGEEFTFDWPAETAHVLGLLVAGSIKVFIGKNKYVLNIHDGFNFSINIEHRFYNHSSSKAEFVAFLGS